MATDREQAGENRIGGEVDTEQSDDVVFDQPELFEINMNWTGVSDRPAELGAIIDAIIEEGVHRGLFYEGGYMQLKNTDNFSARPGSKLHQALTGTGPKEN